MIKFSSYFFKLAVDNDQDKSNKARVNHLREDLKFKKKKLK